MRLRTWPNAKGTLSSPVPGRNPCIEMVEIAIGDGTMPGRPER